MGGGSTKGDSSSRPLTAQERSDIFSSALSNLGETLGASQIAPSETRNNGPTFGHSRFSTTPAKYDIKSLLESMQYETPGAKTLTNGDYNSLQEALVSGMTAPLARQEKLWREQTDEDLAKRGMYTSGIGTRAQGDVTERLAPMYAQAGADATSKRYELQNQENQMLNQVNMENANRAYASKWRPAEYLAGIWNGTGGTISNSSQSGFNFSI